MDWAKPEIGKTSMQFPGSSEGKEKQKNRRGFIGSNDKL
jgi:hypothetical protein